MRRLSFSLSIILAAAALPAGDWTTFGGDPQRTGWARDEKILTKGNVANLQLEWKTKLDNVPKELTSLTAPIIKTQVFTSRGVKDLLVIAGSSDNIYTLDADTGKVLWQKKFGFEAKPPAVGDPNWLCPQSLNATPVIERIPGGLGEITIYAISSDGRLHSLNIHNGEDRKPPVKFAPPFSKMWSLNLVGGVLYTTTSQGCGRTKSGVWAMDLRDPNRPVTNFQAAPAGGGIWGRAGVAIDSTGRIFAETGDGPYDPSQQKYTDTFLGLTPKTLQLADYYTPANREWITKKDLDMGNISPVVFKFSKWELIAGAGKEGVIYLLDAKQLGGADHRTPLFRSVLLTNEDVDLAGRGFWGAFATWEDAKNARWLYAPAWGPPTPEAAPLFSTKYGETPNGSIMAFKVEEKESKPVLTPVWNSRDMSVPEPPIVANGIVFALSNGENVRQLDDAGRLMSTKQRAENPSGNAILYAFDAETGKELFSSGNTIPGWTHFSGIAIAEGRIFVTTWDGMVYAFGLKQQ